MLRGSFYQGRLGRSTRADMFKLANKLDPSAVLFLNEGYVDDRCGVRSSPEKYIQQIINLQNQGAPIGGIGFQGLKTIVYSALDKLGKLGLPIWLTELEVSAANEHVRADDWKESYMTDNKNNISHLVMNADGKANEAGKRFRYLKQEFLSTAKGYVDENGEFKFRGFHGTYTAEIMFGSETISKTFIVEKDQAAETFKML
ncbi:hypothetical protein TIFTF001_010053 [Ficus carica]|uniref:GH10 domain-containing protein n=1 Tax=Ficus carica TaxID=3494 RepID=A0AA87ZWE7_FICCA|nr:hypothetical protein TIFTF001_010053 [Ficus carica]